MQKGSGLKPSCHPDKPYGGHGLCKPCYLKKYYNDNKGTTKPYGIKPTCHPDRPHAANGLCRICYNQTPERQKSIKNYAKNYARRDRLKHHYGITEQDYHRMLEQQNGCCALCHKPATEKTGKLVVDHCHNSNKVRALLHRHCNLAFGFFENPEWRQKAEGYLQSHENLTKLSDVITPEGFCPCGGKMLNAGPPIGTYCERGWNCTNHY